MVSNPIMVDRRFASPKKSMFLSRNKKNNVYPCQPQFYYINVGLGWGGGSKLYRYVFVMSLFQKVGTGLSMSVADPSWPYLWFSSFSSSVLFHCNLCDYMFYYDISVMRWRTHMHGWGGGGCAGWAFSIISVRTYVRPFVPFVLYVALLVSVRYLLKGLVKYRPSSI